MGKLKEEEIMCKVISVVNQKGGVGIGLFIFLWAITEEFGLGCIGLLVMFTGFGQLVIYYTQQDRAPKSNDKSDNARTVFPEKNAEK